MKHGASFLIFCFILSLEVTASQEKTEDLLREAIEVLQTGKNKEKLDLAKKLLKDLKRGETVQEDEVLNLLELLKKQNESTNHHFLDFKYGIDRHLNIYRANSYQRRSAILRNLEAPVSAKKIRKVLSIAADSMRAGARIASEKQYLRNGKYSRDELIDLAITWEVWGFLEFYLKQHKGHNLKPYEDTVRQLRLPDIILNIFKEQNLLANKTHFTPVKKRPKNIEIDPDKTCDINGVIYRNSGIVWACADGGNWCLNSAPQNPGVCDK